MGQLPPPPYTRPPAICRFVGAARREDVTGTPESTTEGIESSDLILPIGMTMDGTDGAIFPAAWEDAPPRGARKAREPSGARPIERWELFVPVDGLPIQFIYERWPADPPPPASAHPLIADPARPDTLVSVRLRSLVSLVSYAPLEAGDALPALPTSGPPGPRSS